MECLYEGNVFAEVPIALFRTIDGHFSSDADRLLVLILGAAAQEVCKEPRFRGDLIVSIVDACDGVEAVEGGVDRGAVADRVETVVDATAILRLVGVDAFAGQAVDVVIAPDNSAAVVGLDCLGAIASRAERVGVAGDRRGHLCEPVHLIVVEAGGQTVGSGDRGHVAGRIVGVGGGLIAKQAAVGHSAEPIEFIPGIANLNAVDMVRRDRRKIACTVVAIRQRAGGGGFGVIADVYHVTY